MRDYRILGLPLLPALALYVYFAVTLWFTQDDAYITYRYVANWLTGDGLVYNPGERIEGFTNFGWVVFLALVGKLGLPYILVSKFVGLFCGAGVIVVTFLMALQVMGRDRIVLAWLATYLVAANVSLAYWSQAGLETGAFALAVSLSLYWYLRGSWLLMWGILLAVWLRPEGALLAGLLVLLEWITTRRWPRFSLLTAIGALVLSLPMVGFKLSYFHSLLPNPFFAKTAANAAQIRNGLEYSSEFFRQYGFFGLGAAVALVFWKKLNDGQRSILCFFLGYALYVTIIGGDVLKVHRFYLPVVGAAAITTSVALHLLTQQFGPQTKRVVVRGIGAILVVLTIYLPWSTVAAFNRTEKALTARMGRLAEAMQNADSSNFTVAAPTIGIFGYQLHGHTVIDMLGLCDSTIARHPEPPIEGMETTWKEGNYKSVYLLERAPEYIVFSTDIKPSAPAEKALMLYDAFLTSYRAVGWFMQDSRFNQRGAPVMAFKRVRAPSKPLARQYPLAWVEQYKRGCELTGGQPGQAIESFQSAQRLLGIQRPYPELLYMMGSNYDLLGHPVMGPTCYQQAIAADSSAATAHASLYVTKLASRDPTAATHRRWLEKLMPWDLPVLDSLAMR